MADTWQREKNNNIRSLSLFLVRQLLTIWVSSISTFVLFVERCVEHAKGMFYFRPSFVLSCCIINVVDHRLVFVPYCAWPETLFTFITCEPLPKTRIYYRKPSVGAQVNTVTIRSLDVSLTSKSPLRLSVARLVPFSYWHDYWHHCYLPSLPALRKTCLMLLSSPWHQPSYVRTPATCCLHMVMCGTA